MKTRIIVISGIDGSGKSTIIAGLEKALLEMGYSTHTPWLRYNHYLTKGVFALAKLLRLYSYEVINGKRVVGYHEFYRSRLISVMFVFSTFLDSLFASLVKVYIPAYVLQKIVICDRWIPDILVDIAIDTGKKGIERDMVWKLMWKLVPRCARTFVIMRDSHDVRNSREENKLSRDFETRYNMYRNMCKMNDLTKINNRGPIEGAVQEIMELVQ